MSDGSYLPPVISQLLADTSDFLAGWEAAAEAAEESAARIQAAQDASSGGPGGGPGGGGAQEQLASSLQDATAAEDAFGTAAEDAGHQVDVLGSSSEGASGGVEALGGSSGDSAGTVAELGAAGEEAGGGLAAVEESAGGADGALAELGASGGDAKTGLSEVGVGGTEATQGLLGVEEAGTAAATGVQNAAKVTPGYSTDLSQMRSELNGTNQALRDAAQAMGVTVDATKLGQNGFDSAGRNVKEYTAAMQEASRANVAAKDAIGETSGKWTEGARAASTAAKSAVDAAEATKAADRAALDAAQSWKSFGAALKPMPDMVDGVVLGVAVLGPLLVAAGTGLAAMAAGAIVVGLGMDGIKEAGAQLDAGLGVLKGAADEAFMKTLIPAANEASAAFPQMKQGVTDVATAIGGMGKGLADVISSARGIQQINDWLSGTAAFFTEGVRGTKEWADAMLTFLSAAAPAMQQFGSDIADVMQDFNRMIQSAAKTGEITEAVSGASKVMKGFGDLIVDVADALMKMSADVGPSVGKALSAIGDAIVQMTPSIDAWVKGFADAITVISKVIGVLGGFKDPLSYIAGALVAVGVGAKVFGTLISPITQVAKVFTTLRDAMMATGASADADTAAAKASVKANEDLAAALGATGDAAKVVAKAMADAGFAVAAEGDAAKVATKANEEYAASMGLAADGAKAAAAGATDAAAAETAVGVAGETAATGGIADMIAALGALLIEAAPVILAVAAIAGLAY